MPHPFEAPHRDPLWQLHFAELFIGRERRHLLTIAHDFSRFIGHSLAGKVRQQPHKPTVSAS